MKFFHGIEDALNYNESHEFVLIYRRVFFPMFVDYKAYDKWVIFLPGACSRSRPMPVFQRSSYANQLNANVISLFDPGLLLGNQLANTWFVGTEARYYGQYLAEIFKRFFKKNNQDFKNVTLFGTSAGGLPALRIAKSIENCTVWLGNAQTRAYDHIAFDRMLPILFPKFTRESCIEAFPNRFDATLMDGEYNLHFFQNKSDRFHYRNHYAYYKSWFDSAERKVNASFYEYDDPVSGHGSVGREKEIKIIKKLLNDNSLEVCWAKRI